MRNIFKWCSALAGEVVIMPYTYRALSVVLNISNIFSLVFFNCNPISDLSCIMGRCVCIMASGEINYYYSDSVLPCQSSRKRTGNGGLSCFSFHSTLCQFTFNVLEACQGGFTLTALNMNLLSGLRELLLSSLKVYDISLPLFCPLIVLLYRTKKLLEERHIIVSRLFLTSKTLDK